MQVLFVHGRNAIGFEEIGLISCIVRDKHAKQDMEESYESSEDLNCMVCTETMQRLIACSPVSYSRCAVHVREKKTLGDKDSSLRFSAPVQWFFI